MIFVIFDIWYNYIIFSRYISEESIFPPHNKWTEKSSSINRTTNACESFHNIFNSYFESPHPNKYKFIEVLKLIQTETVILIQSSNKSKLHGRLQINNKMIFIDTKIKKPSEKNHQILSIYKYWLKYTSLNNVINNCLPLYAYYTIITLNLFYWLIIGITSYFVWLIDLLFL